MARIERFEDIEAWRHARNLTRRIYAVTANDPFAKDFALRDQARRAAVSIMGQYRRGL